MPGERTRDRGDLGELSGILALVTAGAGRISVRVRGTALSPTNDALQVNGDAPAHLIAVDGGLYHLRFERAGGPALETLASSPYYFQVDDSAINPAELFTVFSDAVAEQDRTSQWRRLLAEAVPLTAHLLWPLNVRVLWPIRIDPETHAEVPADAVPAWDPPAGEPLLPLRSTSSRGTPPAIPTSPTIRSVTLRSATAEHRAAIVRRDGDPLWDPVPGEGGVIVPVRLGLISWDVRIDAVQEVLSSLAEAGEVMLWRKSRTVHQRVGASEHGSALLRPVTSPPTMAAAGGCWSSRCRARLPRCTWLPLSSARQRWLSPPIVHCCSAPSRRSISWAGSGRDGPM